MCLYFRQFVAQCNKNEVCGFSRAQYGEWWGFFRTTGSMAEYQTEMKTIALIAAGGAGLRAATPGEGEPKQFRVLAGRAVVAHAVAPFLAHPRIDRILVVVRPGWEDRLADAVGPNVKLLGPVAGGVRRQDSVRLGLEALVPESPDLVLIHDAARPFVDAGLIDRVLDGIGSQSGAIPAVPVADTLKLGGGGMIVATVDRAGLYGAQTPQAFVFAAILAAHRAVANGDDEFTDDAAVAEQAGLAVALVGGDAANRKLTTPEDFAMAERMLADAPGGLAHEFRTGSGADVHAFTNGNSVMLCGVNIPHTHALLGHSDADVGLHALTDALLGAIADGDIGSHFPPSDPKWRAASSDIFLDHARDRVAALGGEIVNVDVTIVCEAPRIGPHRDAMRARIADILRIGMDRVAVKATTSEGLGFTGRREGILAQAIATVRLPASQQS
jgi:2-C-methyl-D-erythritol 4-phosphate cytidylyltransferase / 2-C-methyl-D-erythritol 2,4-cyclodiphosphate synthase